MDEIILILAILIASWIGVSLLTHVMNRNAPS
jgi:hypothetical protein